jgi:polyhydroxyalkanoate synthase subunit PhaC
MVTTRQTGAADGAGPQGPGSEIPALSAIGEGSPLVGPSRAQLLAALARWGTHLLRDPILLAARGSSILAEDLRILAGASTVEPETKDKRFSDDAWSRFAWRRLEQAYLSRRAALLATADEVDLDPKSAERARFALMQIAEALAPTNYLPTNPAALRRLRETGGRSLVDGARHFASDALHNGGLPSQVDARPFQVGRTLAVTPGAVVERTDQYELLQYRPSTPTVHRRPVVVVSPQINKYYFLDIAPGRSFVEHAVARGLQVFMMSWRSVTAECRNWSVDTYVAACQQAIETSCEITGSEDALSIGFCSGGMTQAMLLAHLAAVSRPLVAASALAVAMIDTEAMSALNAFLTKRSAAASVARSRRKGVLPGRDLAKAFAWLRPNDLVWNYWVHNYLLGETPPAFDVLAWNADTTDLPAELHAGMIQLMMDNALMRPGAMQVLGTPVDLSKVTSDLYLVGAVADHLVPWESVYAGTRVHGGDSRFVLSNSGHIQALINPPGNPKASYFVGDVYPPSASEWLHLAERRTGSWWSDWAAWTIERAGEERRSPRRLGSRLHPVLEPAPGTYVLAGRHATGPQPGGGEGGETAVPAVNGAPTPLRHGPRRAPIAPGGAGQRPGPPHSNANGKAADRLSAPPSVAAGS